MKYLVMILFFVGSAYAATNEELERKLEILSEQVEELDMKSAGHSKITWGGYGEFTYKNTKRKTESGALGAGSAEWDAKRFILYSGYDFNENWKMSAELEIEHANSIFLEQGYLSYSHNESLEFKVGVLLIPVGITNLYHEPTTYLGAQRPDIDSKIIPTTWRENGMALTGNLSNFRYTLGVYNQHLAASSSNIGSDGIRKGRQKGSQATSGSLAPAAQIDYLIGSYGYIGGSYYTGRLGGVTTQSTMEIFDLHANMSFAGAQLRAMYVENSIDQTADLNSSLGNTAGGSGLASKMSGYFVEAGYNVFKTFSDKQLIPFVRYEDYDTQKKLAAGYTKDNSKDRVNLTYGINFKPIAGIVFKADYTDAKNEAKTAQDSWNLGAGWNF